MIINILHIRYTYYNMNKIKTLEERLDYLESLLLNEEDKDMCCIFSFGNVLYIGARVC